MKLTKNTKFHNRFLLVEKKGNGSCGEVWLARDEQQENREVALKVFVEMDEKGLSVFRSEYGNMFCLSHPNLLHAYQFDVCNNVPYVVLPYCPESTVSFIGQQVDETTIWCLIRDVASGLAYLHKEGVVHRNIKPDNILMDEQGRFLIADYDISDKLYDELQHSKWGDEAYSRVGAPCYEPPEMFKVGGTKVNASDIWALGALLYEICENELPFFGQGGSMQLNGAQIPKIHGNYSDDLKQTVQKCLAKEPWDRPWADALAKHAQEVIKEKPVAKKPKVSEQHSDPNKANSKDKKPKTLLWVLVALTMGGVGFLTGYYLHKVATKDEVFFSYCKDNPTVDNYRAYVSQFPEGDFVTLAQNWIQKWEADSIAKTDTFPKMLKQEKPDEQPMEQPKKELEKKKEDKGEPNNMEKESNGLEMGGKTIPSTHEKPLAPAKSHDDNVKDLPKTGLTPAEPNRPSPEVNNSKASSRLTPSKEVNANLSGAGEADEEMAYNAIASKINSNTATLDDCQSYLKRFSKTGDGSNSKHWEIVAGKFRVLYSKKIQSCKTRNEIDEILLNHDRLMNELHLSGMSKYDAQMKKMAQSMKKKLKD